MSLRTRSDRAESKAQEDQSVVFDAAALPDARYRCDMGNDSQGTSEARGELNARSGICANRACSGWTISIRLLAWIKPRVARMERTLKEITWHFKIAVATSSPTIAR